MFAKKSQDPELDEAIKNLLVDIRITAPESNAYAVKIAHVATLYKLKEVNSSKSVSADTQAIIAANLIGIMLIVGFERANVVTSKALGFVQKLR